MALLAILGAIGTAAMVGSTIKSEVKSARDSADLKAVEKKQQALDVAQGNLTNDYNTMINNHNLLQAQKHYGGELSQMSKNLNANIDSKIEAETKSHNIKQQSLTTAQAAINNERSEIQNRYI